MHRNNRHQRLALASIVIAGALCACSPKSNGPSASISNTLFPVSIHAHAEDQRSVEGVELWQGKQRLGTTAGTGSAQLTLPGNEGDSVTLNVKCPAGFASPDLPLLVGLRHLDDGSTAARFDVECFSLLHAVVVGVRAENGPRLPILRLKRVVGQTDDQGVAHVLLQASGGEAIALTLDTSRNPSLLPQNPTLDFATRDADELVLVSEKFTIKQAPARRAIARAIPQHL